MIKKQRKPIRQVKSRKTEVSDAYTFSDHIKELRRRIFWVAIVFVVASSLAYHYHDLLVQVVMAPLNGEKLIYLTPGGGFSFIFQVTMYAGLLAAGPTLMHQVYGFLRPALPDYAKKNALKVAFFATFLMLAGVAYGYFVAVPSALAFLSTFAGTEIVPNLTADSYLSFFLAYIGGLALLFQLPLFLIFWHWIKPLKPGGLLKSERYIIIFAFIAAALITPTPDVVNQAMIAVPLIAIYQIGVIAVLVAIQRDKKIQIPRHGKTTHTPPAHLSAPLPTSRPTLIQRPHVVATELALPNSTPKNLEPHSSPSRPSSRPVPVRPRPVPPERPTQPLQRRPAFRIDGMSPL